MPSAWELRHCTSPPCPGILKIVDFVALRQDYRLRTLDETTIDADPIRQFQVWLNEAIDCGLREPNAMTLATAAPDGRPSARIVLLKGVDAAGFVFFSNYESAKGQQLQQNPRAELVFYWNDLERQVRVHGVVARIAAAESDAYFQSRPRQARIGAHASRQSRPLAHRAELEEQVRALEEHFGAGEFPRPADWGGYRLAPESIEFWQGRSNRLHDRLLFEQDGNRVWHLSRLYP